MQVRLGVACWLICMWLSAAGVAFGQMIAIDDTGIVDEDGMIVIDVQSNDLNIGGGVMTTSLFTLPPNGTVELLDADSILYIPNLNYNGIDTFTYNVCNGEEPIPACNTALVIISVLPQPDAPIVFDDTATLNAGDEILINVQLNDINFDAEVLITSIISAPVNGTAVIEGDLDIRYTPDYGFFGVDSLQYAVCNSGFTDFCDTAAVRIEINQINFFYPEAEPDDYEFDAGNVEVLDVLANDSDGDGDNLQVTELIAGLMINTVQLEDGVVSYNASSLALDSFYYVVCDSSSPVYCDTALVRVRVWDMDILDSFSPNNDGINDFYSIDGLTAYPDFTFRVYSRWGQLVYSTNDAFFQWDGSTNQSGPLPTGQLTDGTYFYILELTPGTAPLTGSIVIKR